MAGAAGFVRGLSLPTLRVARLIFPALAATAGMVSATAAVPRIPLPANGINPSLCVVAAVLTWFAAHWMAGATRRWCCQYRDARGQNAP